MPELVCFSPCGNYFALCSGTGKLRIWETETGVLKNEFTPGSHLSSPCSSIAWVPVSTANLKHKSKKRRYSQSPVSLLLLGTDAGRIYFYSLAEGNVVASLEGHNRAVNAISVAYGTDLYSSAANVIFQWDIENKSIKSKWKSDGNISRMMVSEDNSILLTALQSTIVCWNVETCSILRRLKGHKSDIIALCIAVSPSNEKYVFSAATNDRLINVWNISDTDHDRTVAVLTVPDVPSGISCNINSSGLVTLAAVSKRGGLHVYSHQLNGRCGKSIKPKTTVFVTSDAPDSASKYELIPVISARVLHKNVKIVFGSSPFVHFESVDLNSAESELFLVRKDPRRLTRNAEENIKKIKRTEVGENVEYLGPSTMNNISLKRNREQIDDENKVTMETLLAKMNISSKNEPSSDALAHLLIQGLNSQDKDILRSVLLTQSVVKIKSTVERLPAQAVLPLLKIVTNLIQGRTWLSQVGALWLQALLRTHVSQMLADESCSTVIEPMLTLVETRLNCLGPLSQLKGRLDLLIDQTTSTTPAKPVVDIQPLLVYQDHDSPASSNCLLEDADESEGDDDDDDDDDKWANINEDASAAESDDDDENEGSGSEDSDENEGENMDSS